MAALAASGADAGTLLHGAVTDDAGTPIAGAMIIASDAGNRSEMAYSDTDGQFSLDCTLAGTVSLKVRKRFHADQDQSLDLAAGNREFRYQLARLTDPQQISEDHSSLSHFSRIAFDTDEKAPFSRPNFARDCLTCHSVGNSFTRWKRPAEAWVPTIQRMHGYIGNTNLASIRERAERLAKAFDGSLVNSRPVVPIDPSLAHAKVYRWRLDGAGLPHDAAIHRGDGRVYIADQFSQSVIELDLASGHMQTWKEPDDGMPIGGWYTRNGIPPPYGLAVSHAPHSLAEGLDGKFYMTDSMGSTLVEFDPASKQFIHHVIEGVAVYPHTIRVGADGIVWFTIIASNQVGRFDPATQEMKVIPLPDSAVLSNFGGGPSPYGIDVNPSDGSVWYAKLFSDRIGRIDPLSFEVTEFDSPVRGPRRQRFDASGKLWVSGFAEGAIARIDVSTMDAKVYRIPEYAPGEVAAPYALAIHPQTQDVWVNDSMLDMVWRFIPAEERFVAYPLPMKGTYTRDFDFTREGWACTSNNPIPAAALEGGQPELICIDAGLPPPPSQVAGT